MKRSKYRNVRHANGSASKREGNRLEDLRLLEKAGAIKDLRTQVVYELLPKMRRSDGVMERAVKYVADFVYVQDGREVVEDSKGFRTPDYNLKRKMMLHLRGIEIRET